MKNAYFKELNINNNIFKTCEISGCGFNNVKAQKEFTFFRNDLINNRKLSLNIDTSSIQITSCKIINSKCGIWYINRLNNCNILEDSFNLDNLKSKTGRIHIEDCQFIDIEGWGVILGPNIGGLIKIANSTFQACNKGVFIDENWDYWSSNPHKKSSNENGNWLKSFRKLVNEDNLTKDFIKIIKGQIM